ncbi:MAG: nucleotidyltransferase domain-containing protein, partial [Acidobacteriota bacterium]
ALRRSEHIRRLAESYERALKKLMSLPEVERVILFGSYAAGRRDLFTDLDLLVVMCSDQEFVERAGWLLHSHPLSQRLA